MYCCSTRFLVTASKLLPEDNGLKMCVPSNRFFWLHHDQSLDDIHLSKKKVLMIFDVTNESILFYFLLLLSGGLP